MIGGKQTSGPIPGGRDQKELGLKSEGILSRWSRSDEFFVFDFSVVVKTHVVVEVRTHVAATTVCATGRVHTLTCCTHIFLHITRAQFVCAHPLTSSCVSHTRMAQVHIKKCWSHAHVVSLLTSPSPFSRITHLRLLFLHGRFETNLTDAPVHTILPNFPDPKARVKRTLHEDEQFGYLAKSVPNTLHAAPVASLETMSFFQVPTVAQHVNNNHLILPF